MAGRVDYKQKYEELKARFMSSVDAAWRDGYEHGAMDTQTEQVQQDQMQADAMAQQTAGQPMKPSEESAASGEEDKEADGQPSMSQNPNGDELGQHIQKLESMLGKSKISPLEVQDLRKTLADIRSLQVQINLTKSMESIKNTKMGKTRAPFTVTPKLQANLPEQSKKALSLQEKIVGDIFAKWAKDEPKTVSDIASAINAENIVKKD